MTGMLNPNNPLLSNSKLWLTTYCIFNISRESQFAHWFNSRSKSLQGYDLLTRLFEYDPKKRVTAEGALKHRFFTEEVPLPMRKSVSRP